MYDSHQGPVTALKDVDFRCTAASSCACWGPSAAGKSTLIRIPAGLESHNSGQVAARWAAGGRARQDRGMVFQGYTLFPWLTVKRT